MNFPLQKSPGRGDLPSLRLLQGDVLACLARLPDNSVQCVVTSPPYWGLRDYGVSGQLGLEKTPEEYLDKMVAVFREVRRVLRPDGVLFLNMGDSYAGGGFNPRPDSKFAAGLKSDKPNENRMDNAIPFGLKPKDLCGIPWRLALALQADGWWLRSDIIWAKPNPMPESCTDRPTKSHEYIFLMTKRAKYFYDGEAVREPQLMTRKPGKCHLPGKGINEPGVKDWQGEERYYNPNGRNLRTVWEIATEPFPEAHFATYPTELVRRCVAAGTSEKGACPKCGAPWKRVVEKGELLNISHCKTTPTGSQRGTKFTGDNKTGAGWTMNGNFISGWQRETTNKGWIPTCKCGLTETVPCIVLDPFLGSGTTALVAAKMQRGTIGIELSPGYLEMARRRLKKGLGMLVEILIDQPDPPK